MQNIHRFTLTELGFRLIANEAVVIHEPVPVTKAELLTITREQSGVAYRLYLACESGLTPETVLCRDLFEMPELREFPELADDCDLTEND